jgi:hypothetical protein
VKAGIGTSISVALGLILVLAGSGCSQDRSLAGMWKGDRDWKKINTETEAAARAFAAVNLDLKASGEFVLQDGGVPYTGTWVPYTDKVELVVETILNKPLDMQAEQTQKLSHFTVRIENKRLFFKNPIDETEFELKKELKR